MKKNKFVVGITTNYGKDNLVQTIKSLRSSVGVDKFPIIVIADSVKVGKRNKAEIEKMGVKLVENKYKSTLVAKQLQLLRMVKTELVVFTHDDLVFAPDSIAKLVAMLSKKGNTFVCAVNEPLKANGLIERANGTATRINNRIAKGWNNGDNYLAAMGRLMGFKTEWLKNKLNLKEEITSSDAYLYFGNKFSGGKFECVWDGPVFYRAPMSFKEQAAKSLRFQSSSSEMHKYFKNKELVNMFSYPFTLGFRAVIQEFVSDPIATGLYLGIFSLSKVVGLFHRKSINPMWNIELSTKKL